MSFNKLTGCGNILNFIQIDTWIYELTLKFLISYTTVTLNKGQGHPNWYYIKM